MPTQRVPYPQFVAKFDAMIDLYAKQTNIQTMGEVNYPVCTPAHRRRNVLKSGGARANLTGTDG